MCLLSEWTTLNERNIFAMKKFEPLIMSFKLPVVTLAKPPVGWHKTILQPAHNTTVWAWLKTVVILTQPRYRSELIKVSITIRNKKELNLLGHFTSMKNEFGLWTNLLSLCLRLSSSTEGFNKSFASLLKTKI